MGVRPLAEGQIVYVAIPGQVDHPALIVLDLRDGGFVLVNGTGTPEPEPETPVVSLSRSAAGKCGLNKPTLFYGSRKFLWYWRPGALIVEPCGNMFMFPLYRAQIRAAAIAQMHTMKSVNAEIGKLPDGAGISLGHMKTLKEFLKRSTPVVAAAAMSSSPTDLGES